VKKRVLIIENDVDIQHIVSYLLEAEGYEVVALRPVPADQLLQYKAHLMLLDEWIDKKQGHMLCTEIKMIHEIKHIPVIIFSTAPNIAEIAVSCHADGYVQKPFELDDLINEVNRCCLNNVV
jgi:DNA-binding response OmpR family regulator